MLNKELCQMFQVDPKKAQLINKIETLEEILYQTSEVLNVLSEETKECFKKVIQMYRNELNKMIEE